MTSINITTAGIQLRLGVKTDPIEYRYSYEWLFKLLADEGIRHVQLGTFFEMYQLPDDYFVRLRNLADRYQLQISSLFTSHRELGGFFNEDPAWHSVAHRNFERLIEIAALVGAQSAGCNPGSVLRDQMETKEAGIQRYLDHMKTLMAYASDHGVATLTIEPMSCLAEPPTLPGEIQCMALELQAHHISNPGKTASIGYCADISHGYADRDRVVKWDNHQLFEATLPYLHEIHLKNTDCHFNSTFGFSKEEREKGIVQIEALRDLLLANAGIIPRGEIIGYLEIGGPKTGRDYSDGLLEANLRESLRYLQQTFPTGADAPAKAALGLPIKRESRKCSSRVTGPVQISPSVMCADMTRIGEEIRTLEAAGVDMLHFDLMDGHFVPNMPLGLGILEQLRPMTTLPFDVHLMVTDNDFFVKKLLDIGVQQIAVHAESATHLDRTLALIRDAGVKAGVALNPATPLSALDYITEQLDFVLLMTVNPGFASQKRVPSALRKIADCRAYLKARGLSIPIEVDGNVSFEGITDMVAAGADILVVGTSSLFHKSAPYAANMQRTDELICEGLKLRNTCAPCEAAK